MMQVLFYSDTRKSFSGVEQGCDPVGAFTVGEVQYTMSWQDATNVSIKMTVPASWVHLNLFESGAPARKATQRARYIVIQNPFSQQEAFFITGFSAQTQNVGEYSVTVKASDPRVLMDTYPQAGPIQAVHTRSWIDHIQAISKRLSNDSTGTFDAPAKRLPIYPLASLRGTTAEEERAGIVSPHLQADKPAREIQYGAPLPIGTAYDEVINNFGDSLELFPITRWDKTGIYWEWVLRKAWTNNSKLLTVAEGDVTVTGISQDTLHSEALVYCQVDDEYLYHYPSKNMAVWGMNGPWLGVTVESISALPGMDTAALDEKIKKKSITKSQRKRLEKKYAKDKISRERRLVSRESRKDSGSPTRTEIQADITTQSLGEFLMPGVSIAVDAGDIKFRFRITEADFSYTSESGWTQRSAT